MFALVQKRSLFDPAASQFDVLWSWFYKAIWQGKTGSI
jgi:hypothetical protein